MLSDGKVTKFHYLFRTVYIIQIALCAFNCTTNTGKISSGTG